MHERDKCFILDEGIMTYLGNWVNIFDIKRENISMIDIAHSLSMQPRFNGHMNSFYSVAEHSIWVADRMPDEYKFTGLMHDATEAYLSDVPAPFKSGLKNYKELEDNLMKEIALKFPEIVYPFPDYLKEVDLAALQYEWVNYMLADKGEGMSQREAEEKFLDKAIEYSKLCEITTTA